MDYTYAYYTLYLCILAGGVGERRRDGRAVPCAGLPGGHLGEQGGVHEDFRLRAGGHYQEWRAGAGGGLRAPRRTRRAPAPARVCHVRRRRRALVSSPAMSANSPVVSANSPAPARVRHVRRRRRALVSSPAIYPLYMTRGVKP
eukprot:1189188-Prorocentrum_minimum.AAC.2